MAAATKGISAHARLTTLGRPAWVPIAHTVRPGTSDSQASQTTQCCASKGKSRRSVGSDATVDITPPQSMASSTISDGTHTSHQPLRPSTAPQPSVVHHKRIDGSVAAVERWVNPAGAIDGTAQVLPQEPRPGTAHARCSIGTLDRCTSGVSASPLQSLPHTVVAIAHAVTNAAKATATAALHSSGTRPKTPGMDPRCSPVIAINGDISQFRGDPVHDIVSTLRRRVSAGADASSEHRGSDGAMSAPRMRRISDITGYASTASCVHYPGAGDDLSASVDILTRLPFARPKTASTCCSSQFDDKSVQCHVPQLLTRLVLDEANVLPFCLQHTLIGSCTL